MLEVQAGPAFSPKLAEANVQCTTDAGVFVGVVCLLVGWTSSSSLLQYELLRIPEMGSEHSHVETFWL